MHVEFNCRSAVAWLLIALIGSAAAPVIAGDAASHEARLLRHPAVSRSLVAFAYGGDLWVVSRSGGQARRLTSTPGVETAPSFSPDGSQLAFTATVAGNTDAYVVATAGGEPKRLTHHPAFDSVRGWTPDGRRVVFASTRNVAPTPDWQAPGDSQDRLTRLWTIELQAGFPEALPPPRAYAGVLSPDGRRLAYQELPTPGVSAREGENQTSLWRHYRGGRTQPIRVMTLAGDASKSPPGDAAAKSPSGDYSIEKLPWSNSKDVSPMWIGDTLYFLSDRNHTVNLFAYHTQTKTVTQLTHHEDSDIMSASAGADAVVYEQAGYVHLFDIASQQSRRLTIEVTGDFPWARPQLVPVSNMIRSAALSPTGAQAAFEARGEIFVVPAPAGGYRNITQSSGAHDRSPAWSPDGTRLAWLSDASGEYQLMIGEPRSASPARAISLPSTAFFSEPGWSPDGKQILLEDNHLNLWLLELASGRATKIDTNTYDSPGRKFSAVWSPDSRWVAYSKQLDNALGAIFVYSTVERKAHQLTDAIADATAPAFDASGRYLYFLASTDYALRTGWVDLSSLERRVHRSIHLIVLRADEPSPLLPRADDEPAGSSKIATDTAKSMRIDFDGIEQRIVALNVAPGDYAELSAGAPGTIFYTEPVRAEDLQQQDAVPRRLHRYQLTERASQAFLEGIRSYGLSADRKTLLYQSAGSDDSWGVVSAEQPAHVGDGALNVAQLQMQVDPRAEWANMFREAWRIQREFFYDARMHGADWQAIYDKYHPLVEHIRHRADLTYLQAQLGGELTVGHSSAKSGAESAERPVQVGLLGADFAIENGRYRIRRIFTGDSWNPQLAAPLGAPGIGVTEGDYLLEVNGRPLVPPTNVYSLFAGTVGKQTLLRVSRTASSRGSRLVTVVPTASENGLRTFAWAEENRRLVDQLSAGRLAYVWLPNTEAAGYLAFNRYLYAQQHKAGAIIDDRYNSGGYVPDSMVSELNRERLGYFARRDGKLMTEPLAGLFGPKVMLINESAGSGGDLLPYWFKQRKMGPLVGTRTWGGSVGSLDVPTLIDGGSISAPSMAFYGLDGQWAVENEGVAPDIEVENTPAEAINGRDLQLERAVQEALELLEQQPAPRVLPRPPSIDRVSKPAPSVAFTHVTVIDATGAPEKPDHTVIITGERITAVGPARELIIPEGARVIDARGKYLIPGLWDLHVHLHYGAPDVLPVFVAYGVTGIRDLNTAMPEIQRLREAGRAGTLVVPRIVASGSMIEAGIVKDIIEKTAPPVIADLGLHDRVFVNTAGQARRAVRSLARLHPDLLKLHVNVNREVYFAVLDEAARVGLPVAGHFPKGEGAERITLREVADAGQRSIEHRNELGGVAAEFAALTDAERQTLIAHLKARNVTFVPTFIDIGSQRFRDGSADARLERASSDPRARYISPYLWEAWRAFLSMQKEPEPAYDKEAAFLRELHRGAVPILPGTDFTVPFVFPGSSLHEELIEFVEQVGMTPSEALQSATRMSAELLGLQDILGTVRPGKMADLLLLDANPLVDIANTQRIHAVVRAGRVFDRQALDDLLAQAASNLQKKKSSARGAFSTKSMRSDARVNSRTGSRLLSSDAMRSSDS